MDGGPNNRHELEELLEVHVHAPRGLLLDAYTRGRYAAHVGFNTTNPYRDDLQMAAAWELGWESADGD